MIDLSIIIPSIRTDSWEDLLNSIKYSCIDFTYEVIFVGPFTNSDEHDGIFQDGYSNIKYVRDFGSPNRCQQIGMAMAEGEYVTWGSDDCMYTKGAIDNCLYRLSISNNFVLVANYNEGGNEAVSNFALNVCYPNTKHIKDDWVIFNAAFMRRSLFDIVGGFDCSFDVTCVGHADLAARCQQAGYKPILHNIKLLECSHMPGTSGDHAPIHYAQISQDEPNYFNKYNKEMFPPIKIDINNWKETETIWIRRFGVDV